MVLHDRIPNPYADIDEQFSESMVLGRVLIEQALEMLEECRLCRDCAIDLPLWPKGASRIFKVEEVAPLD